MDFVASVQVHETRATSPRFRGQVAISKNSPKRMDRYEAVSEGMKQHLIVHTYRDFLDPIVDELELQDDLDHTCHELVWLLKESDSLNDIASNDELLAILKNSTSIFLPSE